jgi:hypothetical protein
MQTQAFCYCSVYALCISVYFISNKNKQAHNSEAFSPQTNYTHWMTAAGWRIYCQHFWIEESHVVSVVVLHGC